MNENRVPINELELELQILKLFEDEYRDVPSLYEKYGFTSIFISSPYYKILIGILREYVAQFKIKHSKCDLYNLSNKLQKLTKKNKLAFCVSTNKIISDNIDKLKECYTAFIDGFKLFFQQTNKANYINEIAKNIGAQDDFILFVLNRMDQMNLKQIMDRVFGKLTKTEKLSEQREGGDYFYYYHCY